MPKSASHKARESPGVLSLVRAIIRDDAPEAARLLGMSSLLARECLAVGATRQAASDFYFREIEHYLFAGDTPLHAAAACYRVEFARELIKKGADVAARNRRGAEPLHYAADGGPASRRWNPQSQAEMIAFLIKKGANPNALPFDSKTKADQRLCTLPCKIQAGAARDHQSRRPSKERLLSCCSKPARTRKTGMREARLQGSVGRAIGYARCCRKAGLEMSM